MNELTEEKVLEDARDAVESEFAEVVQSTYEGFKALGRPHKIAVEDTNQTLNIDNTAFYIDTQSIPFTDLSKDFEIEWVVWNKPYQRLLGSWIEL